MTREQLLGTVLYYVTRTLHSTLRVVVAEHPEYRADEPYLFAAWHGKQFLPVLELTRHRTPRALLVSPSRDGEILATLIQKLGSEVLRGSSRHNNVAALVAMMRKLKEGYSVGYGIDGPIGPIHKVKPGMTHMAQKLGIKIVPVGTAFSRKWVAEKAWDKYEIPKPFAKAALYLGKPISIAKTADLEQCNHELECRLHEAEAEAKKLI